MTSRRLLLAVSTAVLLAGGSVALPASAGVQAPRDMIATPNTGPVGTNVVISNAENGPCGGEEGDGPAQVELIIIRPDGTEDDATVLTDDETGNWSVGYINTDLVGVYTVEGDCSDQDVPEVRVNATGFSYTDATFTITADEPTSTTAAPTTTAAPAPAVAATAAFTG
jgi:hypothetical protein